MLPALQARYIVTSKHYATTLPDHKRTGINVPMEKRRLPKPQLITKEKILKVLRKANPTSAPGGKGLSYMHLEQLLQCEEAIAPDDLLTQLLGLCNRIVTGKMPEPILYGLL